MALELIKLSDLDGKIPGPDWIQPEYSLEMRTSIALRLTAADMIIDQVLDETDKTERNRSLIDPTKKGIK